MNRNELNLEDIKTNEIIIKGKYNTAVVKTKNIEEAAINRVNRMASLDYLKGSKIVMMPDVHEGKGCAIGTSLYIKDRLKAKISPAFIGVDIGCGMSMYPVGRLEYIDLEEFDKYVNENISTYPRTTEQTEAFFSDMTEERRNECNNIFETMRVVSDIEGGLERDHLLNSIGTLGGGNHFVELGSNNQGEYFITVHSGSRFLGAKTEKYYQDIAVNSHNKIDTVPIINELRRQNKHKAIQPTVELLKQFDQMSEYAEEECYLQGNDLENYLKDMEVAVVYAKLNRILILEKLLKYFDTELNLEMMIDSPHNYISVYKKGYMIRKGACNAEMDRDVLIPINMRDGIIVGKGKGNPDWNESAPHGAGRLMSRRKAKASITLETFKEQMQGIYSSTVVEDTLDEAPDAYKPMQEILDNIKDTVYVTDIVKPIYNYKGIEEKKWWEKK